LSQIIFKKSKWYFKQTIILFSVSIFLFLLTSIYHLGIIGVIVFIRALFMLNTELKSFKNYSVKKDLSGYDIHRNNEFIHIPLEDIKEEKFEKSKLGYSTLFLTLKPKHHKKESKIILKYLFLN